MVNQIPVCFMRQNLWLLFTPTKLQLTWKPYILSDGTSWFFVQRQTARVCGLVILKVYTHAKLFPFTLSFYLSIYLFTYSLFSLAVESTKRIHLRWNTKQLYCLVLRKFDLFLTSKTDKTPELFSLKVTNFSFHLTFLLAVWNLTNEQYSFRFESFFILCCLKIWHFVGTTTYVIK